MTAWLLQGNPRNFSVDVALWQPGDLSAWCVVRYRDQVAAGDDFAFWVSGRAAGVHALGTVTAPAQIPVDADPLTRPRYQVGLQVDVALFDRPVLRAQLAADTRFATAAVLRQPYAANPFPLTWLEWQAVRDHASPAVTC